MNIQKTFKELKNKLLEVSHLASSASVLQWDLEVYLPKRGVAPRAKSLSFLAAVVHEKFTSPEFERLITELKNVLDKGLLGESEACIVREVWRDFSREKKLPKEFVEELSRTTAEAHYIWVEARRKSDFSIFRPKLEKIIELKRKEAEFIGYKTSPYNTLIDFYEKDATAEELSVLFEELKNFLVPFLKKIISSGKKINQEILKGDYDIGKQKEFNRKIAEKIGFDFEKGRIDESTHPFTISFNPEDVRITTRFDKTDIFSAISSTVHEAGHALYEQGLKVKHFGTPLGEYRSHGIHESQSRLWENLVGRSLPFWRYWYPELQKTFPQPFTSIKLDDFYKAINFVRPSFIRTESDEVTYNLHIILRFEVEKNLIEGSIEAKDLPEVWNEKTKELLGLKVPDDASGVLQDVHWSGGNFGYFPTYTLGNLYAAQFYDAAKKQILNLEKQISLGHFEHLLEWLRKNIHVHGKFYFQDELLKKSTGEKLNSRYFIDYLTKKYGEIYGINKK